MMASIRFYELKGRWSGLPRLVDIRDIPEPLPPEWILPVPARASVVRPPFDTLFAIPPQYEVRQECVFKLRRAVDFVDQDVYEYVCSEPVPLPSTERAMAHDLSVLRHAMEDTEDEWRSRR